MEVARLLEMATHFSGRSADPNDRIYEDLDINGGDFIEFVVAVERCFLTELNWVSPPLENGGAFYDPTVSQLANFIENGVIPSGAAGAE
jgi:hypothetical protein